MVEVRKMWDMPNKWAYVLPPPPNTPYVKCVINMPVSFLLTITLTRKEITDTYYR